MNHIYRLGHCKDLSVAEFEELSQHTPYERSADHILSSYQINVNETGGLVYGCVILDTIYGYSKKRDIYGLVSHIKSILSSKVAEDKWKKVGICCPSYIHKEVLKVAKQAGCKKVNLIDNEPNYGHWKSTKNWLMMIEIDSNIHFGIIESFADQQLWSELDQELEYGDMKRGIINLKLGRSLVNLASKNTIWDPFCGQGRLIIGGLDKHKKFIASDIDTSCIPEAQSNIIYATQKISKRNPVYTPVVEYSVLDATQLDDYKTSSENFSGVSIVTEGYLGQNFTSPPSREQAQQEWVKLERMWTKVLTKSHSLGIPEMILCIPCYMVDGKRFVPSFIHKIAPQIGYNVALLAGRKDIVYSRQKSVTGHVIIKLVIR